MKIEEISRYALSGDLPDKYMTCPERCLFYSLRDLYALHKEKRITKAEGENRKEKLLKQYEKDCEELNYSKMFLQYQGKFWKGIENAAMRYRKNPTVENADAFIEAVYGVGKVPTLEEGDTGDGKRSVGTV